MHQIKKRVGAYLLLLSMVLSLLTPTVGAAEVVPPAAGNGPAFYTTTTESDDGFLLRFHATTGMNLASMLVYFEYDPAVITPAIAVGEKVGVAAPTSTNVSVDSVIKKTGYTSLHSNSSVASNNIVVPNDPFGETEAFMPSKTIAVAELSDGRRSIQIGYGGGVSFDTTDRYVEVGYIAFRYADGKSAADMNSKVLTFAELSPEDAKLLRVQEGLRLLTGKSLNFSYKQFEGSEQDSIVPENIVISHPGSNVSEPSTITGVELKWDGNSNITVPAVLPTAGQAVTRIVTAIVTDSRSIGKLPTDAAWAVTDLDGFQIDGVSIAKDANDVNKAVLTVQPGASAANLTVTLTYKETLTGTGVGSGSEKTETIDISLVRDVSAVAQVVVTGDAEITIPADENAANSTATYTAEVKDQYGEVMNGQTVSWTGAAGSGVTGAKDGENYKITVTHEATYSELRVQAEAGAVKSAEKAVRISKELTLSYPNVPDTLIMGVHYKIEPLVSGGDGKYKFERTSPNSGANPGISLNRDTGAFEGSPNRTSDSRIVEVTVTDGNGKQAIATISFPAAVEKAVTKLEITTPPTKTAYIAGQTFDPAGMVVTATYNDGSTEAVTNYTVTPSGALTAGTNKVTISFGGQSTEQAISVTAKAVTKLEITAPPTKTAYIAGQTFDATGIVVKATYNDGSTEAVTGYTTTPSGALTTSDTKVTIAFGGQTVEQAISVTAKAVTKLEITAPPTKTAYIAGQTFDATGMVVKATYNDGSIEEVTNYTVTPSGALTTSDTKVTIAFGGQTVEQEITVNAAAVTLTGLTITQEPDNTEYTEGERFDPTGMVVKATYSDGTTNDDFKDYSVRPDGALSTSDTQVTIYVGGVEATQSITVNAVPVTLLRIEVSGDFKTNYKLNEAADWSGMVVTAHYSDGSEAVLTENDYTVSGFESSVVANDQVITVAHTDSGKVATFIIVISDKEFPTGAPTLGKTEITYRDALKTITLSGDMDGVAGTFAWQDGDETPDAQESYGARWIFTPEDTDTYATVTGVSYIKVNKARPTGTPSVTNITSSGRTLADANLGIGSIVPTGGSIAWNEPATTAVTSGASYGWTYTPSDTNNYELLTGSIVLWTSSGGGSTGGGGGGSSTRSYTVTYDAGEHGKLAEGAKATESVTSGKNPSKVPGITPDEGWSFLGWSLDGKTVVDPKSQKITGNVTFTALYEQQAEEPEFRFSDVEQDDWFHDAVYYVHGMGLFTGTSETTFSPDLPMDRGMLATVLYRLSGETVSQANPFIDVDAGMYYADAVAWAASNNIVNGVGEGLFAPTMAITREQMVTMLYRYAQFKNMDTANQGVLTGYNDASDVSDWAVESMAWAVGTGLVTGRSESILDPTGTATRAEVAAIFMRFVEMSK